MVNRTGHSLRVLALFAALSGSAQASNEQEAVTLARQGVRLQPFFEAYVAAKSGAATAGRAVVASTGYVASLPAKPVVGLAGALIDTAFRGQALFEEAKLRYEMGEFESAARTLNQVPNEFRQANLPTIDALRVRLALRGALDLPADKAVALPLPDDASGIFNQVLLLLRRQRQDLALQRLDSLNASRAHAAPIRDRARLWSLVVRAEGERTRSAAPDARPESDRALPELSANHPLSIEWLLAYLRTNRDASPERVAAVANTIARRMPDALLVFEAREHLATALNRQGATAQSLEMTHAWIGELVRSIEQLEQLVRRTDVASIQDLEKQTAELGGAHRARVQALFLRKLEIRKTMTLLDAWRPHLERLGGSLRKDRKALASDLFQQAQPMDEGDSSNRPQLLRRRMVDLLGEPLSREMSFRLFFGLSAWELGFEFPEHWRPETEAANDPDASQRQRRQSGGPSRRELLNLAL